MPLLQLLLLALVAPAICYRFGRIALAIWIPVLIGFGIWQFIQASRIDRDLDGRASISLPASTGGRQRVSIAPLPGVEAVHVSLKKNGMPLEMEAVERSPDGPARWAVPGESMVVWFHDGNQSMELPDDGTPLFEIGSHPLKGPVTLEYDDAPFLDGAVLHVRPDWFTLKMLAPIAALYRLLGAAYGAGMLLTAILLAVRFRRPASAPGAPSGACGKGLATL